MEIAAFFSKLGSEFDKIPDASIVPIYLETGLEGCGGYLESMVDIWGGGLYIQWENEVVWTNLSSWLSSVEDCPDFLPTTEVAWWIGQRGGLVDWTQRWQWLITLELLYWATY